MHSCPVCGYESLKNPPRSAGGGGSYEICPACGYQFGVDDDDRRISHDQWRRDWIGKGMPWSSSSQPKPKGWRPKLPPIKAKISLKKAGQGSKRKS